MARKKDEGIEALKPKEEPKSIQEITMLDWFAAYAILGGSTMATPEETAKAAFDTAEACMAERARRL